MVRCGRTAGAVAAACAMGLLIPIPAAAQTARGQAARAQAAAELSGVLEATTARVSPAVVEIFTTAFVPAEGLVPRSADLVTTARASGSGVIVAADGYILTNAHVVRGAQRLRVEIPARTMGRSILARPSRTVPATIVGLDIETDLAVLKVDERGLPALSFGDSDDLNSGQLVLAFGSPRGLQNSVSLGVVSAVARQLEPESPMIYIQTDASINPGSSGGPLVDLQGRIVGINTLIVTQAGGYEGLAFAAPSNIVRTVYEQIRKNGRVRRGDIGLRPQTITPALAAGLKLPRDGGVILADVAPGSMAARAGLRPGDLVVAIDGKPMENGRQLQVTLYRRFVGDVVTLDILRDGQPMKFPVAMTEREDPLEGLSAGMDPRQHLVPRLGMLGLDLDARIAALLPALRVKSGVVVVSTVAGAIDSRDGGVAVGDVIYAVNRTPVTSLAALASAIERMTVGESVVLHLDRQGTLVYLAFTIE